VPQVVQPQVRPASRFALLAEPGGGLVDHAALDDPPASRFAVECRLRDLDAVGGLRFAHFSLRAGLLRLVRPAGECPSRLGSAQSRGR